ncbi:MAG: NAD-dependent epimerase/dehydratase family protein [Bacteroidota bacterium]
MEQPVKYHLVSGACGFVGRNLVKRLSTTTNDIIVMVDDLSVGIHPDEWLEHSSSETDTKSGTVTYNNGRQVFLPWDFRDFLRREQQEKDFFSRVLGLPATKFNDAWHFAAIVGGRSKIDGDPMMVALDLAIDAEFFYWVTRHKPERVMFPSSSAAYPVSKQTVNEAIALSETDINFANMGQPDMTYGWSKLTGEYLGQIAAKYYNISVASVRPFSGYGEDQDLTYPVPAIAARAAKKEDPFEVWGTGKQGRDFVHIDDCIDCIIMAMDNISDGTAINIGSGRLTSFLEIIELFTEFAGYNPPIKPLLDKPVGVHSRYSNMDYVTERFGWKPKVSLREGMKRVYDASVKRLQEQEAAKAK